MRETQKERTVGFPKMAGKEEKGNGESGTNKNTNEAKTDRTTSRSHGVRAHRPLSVMGGLLEYDS